MLLPSLTRGAPSPEAARPGAEERRSWVARLAAFLGAVAALILVVVPVWQDPPGGEVPTEFVQSLDETARGGPADVIVLGDSTANRDVDSEILGGFLRTPPLRVLNMARELGAPAPVWYAILKERVYGNGLRPKLVVVVGTMPHLMTTRLEDGAFYLLDEQVDIPDAALAKKSWPVAVPSPWDRALGRIRVYHEHIVAWFRYAPAASLLATPDADDQVTSASRQVFGDLHTSSNSAPEGPPPGQAYPNPSFATTPEDSLLPDLAALVKTNGGQLVVVVAPVLFHGVHTSDPQPVDIEAGLTTLAGRLGVGWLDDRDIVPDRARFDDAWHLNDYGKEAFTAILARQLLTPGGVLDTPPGGALRRPAVTVTRTGTIPEVAPDALIREGETCVVTAAIPAFSFLSSDALAARSSRVRSPLLVYQGDQPLESPAWAYDRTLCSGYYQHEGDSIDIRLPNGPYVAPVIRLDPRVPVPVSDRGFQPVNRYWLYPGTTLRWDFAEPWPVQADHHDVVVRVLRMSDRGEPPALRINDEPIPLVPDGDALRASVSLPRPGGAWSVEVSSPPAGAYAIVEELTLLAGEQRTSIVAPPYRQRIDVYAAGTLTVKAPPRRPVPAPTFPGDFGSLWTPAPTFNQTGCSPWQVLHHGEALPRTGGAGAGLSFGEAGPRGPPTRPFIAWPDGSFDHIEDRLHIGLLHEEVFQPDRSDYATQLDPDRRCWARKCSRCFDRAWIHPGDQLTIRLPPSARSGVKEPLMALEVGADWNTDPPEGAVLSIQVAAEGVTRLHRQVLASTLRDTLSLRLSPPIGPGEAGEVVITLTSPPTMPSLLLSTWLGEL